LPTIETIGEFHLENKKNSKRPLKPSLTKYGYFFLYLKASFLPQDFDFPKLLSEELFVAL